MFRLRLGLKNPAHVCYITSCPLSVHYARLSMCRSLARNLMQLGVKFQACKWSATVHLRTTVSSAAA